MQPIDPYRFDSQSSQTWNAGAPLPPTEALPSVVIAGMVIDLVFCVLRLLILGFSIIGLAMLMRVNDGMKFAAIFEVLTGVIMVVFGIAGDSLVLAKKRIGIPLCWVAVGGTVLSILVGVGQLFMMQQGRPELAQGPALVGAIIGGALAAIIRFGLLAFYVYCIITATTFLRNRDANLGR
jgi:hypothetical protein